MKRTSFLVTLVLLAACESFAEPYDPAKHGNPIVVTSGPVEIDGLVGGTNTVIDGLNKVRCATLGPGVTLKNFTLRNGLADWGGGALGGKLVNCRIENCTADLGGGAFGATLENCTVIGCTAVESGAALGDCAAADCTITGNRQEITSSAAAVHGGLFFGSKLDRCVVTGNDIQLGADAPVFGGLGARMTLTGCMVADNTLVADASVCYGRRYYDTTVDGRYCLYDDATAGEPENPFDGSVVRYFATTLEDGASLTFTTARETVRSGISTVSFTANLTRDGISYSYAGGVMIDGVVEKFPTSRTYGAPKFTSLAFSTTMFYGVLGGETVQGAAVTPQVFEEGEFELTPLQARVGVAAAAQVVVDATWGPVKYAASKLPSGLKIDAKTGAVTGVPTKAGQFLTKVTVTSTLNSSCKSVMEFPFVVDAIDDWSVGTFDGGGDGTQVSLTVSKTGKVSGKCLTAERTWTLSAASYARYAETDGAYVADIVFKSGSGKGADTFTSELTVVDGDDGANVVFGGIATNEYFLAYQNRWKLSPWKEIAKGFSKAKAYEYAPTGFGADDVITLKVASSGKVTVKGKFAKSVDARGRVSWYSASGTAVLCPQTKPDAGGAFEGVVFVYFPTKAKTPLANGYAARVRLAWDGAAFVAP